MTYIAAVGIMDLPRLPCWTRTWIFLLLYILSNQHLVNFFTVNDRSLYYSSIFLLFIELDKVINLLYLLGTFHGVMKVNSWNLPAAYMLKFKYYCFINTSWHLNRVNRGQWEKKIIQILHTKVFFLFFKIYFMWNHFRKFL